MNIDVLLLFCMYSKATKREERLQKEEDDRVRMKASIDIPLLPSSRQDERLAKLYRSEPVRSRNE